MSTSNASGSPMFNNRIGTIAELRDRISKDVSLLASRRSDMTSGLSGLAKALGCPAEAIPAVPSALRTLLDGKTAAMVGLKSGRWRNIQSLTAMALSHVGLILVHGRIREAPSPAWLAILHLLEEGGRPAAPGPHFHLWRLARYCTLIGVEPQEIDDALIGRFQSDLEHRSLVSEPARAARDAARTWNAAAIANSLWPQQQLTIADNRNTYALPPESYPASLRVDIEAWVAWMGNTAPFIERNFKPLRAISIATKRRELSEYLAALVDRGAKQDDMISLASVVTPDQARLALHFFWDRAGQKKSVQLYHMCGLVIAIARHWAKLPRSDIDALRVRLNQFRPKNSGLTPRNTSLLRQFEDPDKLDALLTLPTKLVTEARNAGPPTIQFARQVQAAVALEILLNVPLRIRNLAALQIGNDLTQGPGKLMSIAIPASDTKNGVPISAPLPKHLTEMINIYLTRYWALLQSGSNAWIFPGQSSTKCKSEDGLRNQIMKIIADRAGVKMNPHLFRHFAAWITLRHNPAAHGQVQRILGHMSLSSTMNAYSGLEAPAAIQHYDNLLQDLRNDADRRAVPARRVGRSK